MRFDFFDDWPGWVCAVLNLDLRLSPPAITATTASIKEVLPEPVSPANSV